MSVIVPEEQLSLAIGRRGQNVKLAAKLMGWKLDIVSEEGSRRREMEKGKILRLPGMDPLKVARLGRADVHSLEGLAQASPELLVEVLGMDLPGAEALKDAAREAFEAEVMAATSEEDLETPPEPESEPEPDPSTEMPTEEPPDDATPPSEEG